MAAAGIENVGVAAAGLEQQLAVIQAREEEAMRLPV